MSLTRIQLPLPFPEEQRPRSRWEALGFAMNPFPESGVATGVDYNEHQKEEIHAINAWLGRTVDPKATQWRPLLIKGSIGVGKTHVLRRIERVIENSSKHATPSKVGVSYHIVTGLGVRNLLLSNLLLEALQATLPGQEESREEGELPLVHKILGALRESREQDPEKHPLKALSRTSPLRAPLKKILLDSNQDEVEQLFSSWLMRRDLTRAALERIGARGRLEGEGEAVRAYAHVFRLAHTTLGFQVWIMLLDQIEDLWNNKEVTPLKRARFLTDLRTLVDEGLEGAPIVPVLAWNTEVSIAGKVSAIDVEEKVASEYRALSARLPKPVDLPMLLISEHAYNFAVSYIEAVGSGRTDSKTQMLAALEQDQSAILGRVPERGNGRIGDRVNQRAWLDALREWAEEPAAGDASKPTRRLPRAANVRLGRAAR